MPYSDSPVLRSTGEVKKKINKKKTNPDSEILKVAEESYKRLFGVDAKVKAIHAGLECGLFLDKYPALDMISFGPTLTGVHSPDERMHIPSVDKFWKHLLDVSAHIPAKN